MLFRCIIILCKFMFFGVRRFLMRCPALWALRDFMRFPYEISLHEISSKSPCFCLCYFMLLTPMRFLHDHEISCYATQFAYEISCAWAATRFSYEISCFMTQMRCLHSISCFLIHNLLMSFHAFFFYPNEISVWNVMLFSA
jgi:hypothetical protein